MEIGDLTGFERGVIGLLAIIVPGTVISALYGLPTRPESSSLPPAASADPAREELERLLLEYNRTWRPAERARLLERERDRASRLARPLVEILSSSGSHALLPPTIEVAAALGVASCREPLLALAQQGPEATRGAALLAADRITPLDEEELAAHLDAPSPTVVEAALRVCRDRDERPLEAIIGLLSHPDDRTRASAAEAIPPQMPDDALEALLRRARNAPVDHLTDHILAIRNIEPTEPLLEFLREQLTTEDPARQNAVLRVFRTSGTPAGLAAELWRLAGDEFVTLPTRACALECLERGGAIPVESILEAAPALHPYLQYFAARCLVRAGERIGIRLLIGILETESFRFEDCDLSEAEIRYAARKLLSDVSNLAPQSDTGRWMEWLRGLVALRPRPLTAAPLESLPD